MEDIRKMYESRRNILCAGLIELGWPVEYPKATMFVWAKIPSSYKDGFVLSDEVLYKSNVFITPGGIFGSAGDKYIRVSLCSTGEKFEEAIQANQYFLN